MYLIDSWPEAYGEPSVRPEITEEDAALLLEHIAELEDRVAFLESELADAREQIRILKQGREGAAGR